MTSASWAPGSLSAPGDRIPRARRNIRLWHVVCVSVGLCGCIYPFPPDLIPANNPPELKTMNPPANTGEPVEIVGRDQVFYLVVLDEERDDVHFDWALSADGPLLNQAVDSLGSDGSEVSQLTLGPDPELDGQTLRCSYWDAGNGDVQPPLEWTLSVPSAEEP